MPVQTFHHPPAHHASGAHASGGQGWAILVGLFGLALVGIVLYLVGLANAA